MPYLRNKRTGEVMEVDASGRPVGQRPPMNPEFPYKGPQAAASLGQTQATTTNTRVNAQKTQQEIEQSGALFAAQKQEAEAKARIAQMQAEAAEREAASKDPLNTQQVQAAEADAMSKLKTIDRIRSNHNSSWLPSIGFGAETMAGVGGTGAANIAADIDSIKAGGALTEIMKMTQATGKNPFTPMSNSDVETIARNVGNLKQNQSPDNFFANLGNYQGAYQNAYSGAVGKRTLDSEIQRLLPTIPPAKRAQFRADAIRRYEDTMRTNPTGKRPKEQRGRSAPRFLGWED